MLGLSFGLGAAAAVAVVVVCFITGKHFRDHHDTTRIPLWTSGVGVCAVLFVVVLLPSDINLASDNADKPGASTAIEIVYYVLYTVACLYVFIVVPFCYWFYTEYDEIISLPRRCFGGAKWTIIFVMICTVLLLFGCLWRPQGVDVSNANTAEWVDFITHETNSYENGIMLFIGSITLVGLLSWCMYTAYGLVGFPLSLIKGFRQIEKDLKVIDTDIDKNKSEVRAIHAKYLGGRTMSVEDEERLKLLKRQEEIMQNETWKIKHSSRCWSFIRLLKRYSFVFGIFFFLVSVLIMVSIIISQINSILYSPCGIGCGFMLSHPDIPNPVDGLLVLLSPYFPLDYAIYIPLVAYLVACTIYSVQLFGIRLICIPIGVLESHKTLPQALLSLCLVTILATLGLNLQLPLLAPQYVLFGPQEWTNYNNTSVSCSFEAPVSSCVLSEMGKFITGVQLDLNIFAHALFWVTWLFVFLWFCAVMHVLVQRKRAHDQSMRDAVESPVLLETTTKV